MIPNGIQDSEMLVRLLLAVKSRDQRRRLSRLLDQPDLVVESTSSADEIWKRFARESFDLLIIGRSFLGDPPGNAVDNIRDLPEAPEIVVVQEREDHEDRAQLLAAGCMGAVDVGLSDSMLASAIAALVARRREAMMGQFRAEEVEEKTLGDFSSQSPAIQDLLALAERVAHSDTSLLILGETGVGKEWLARAIHAESPRRQFPFVALNCAAVPETLLESELFGHEKGAFTGADRARRGQVEMAHRGTLFLDEIADMAPHLQGKLLRVLQERTIQRLGGEKSFQVDVRIMAATNRDLDQAMQVGEFRPDLYYRLSVVTLTIPPLRERREDIPPLAQSYLDEFSVQLQHDVGGIRPEAMRALVGYAWPGNVRELINVIERAVLLSSSPEIGLEDLPHPISANQSQARGTLLADGSDRLVLSTAGWTDKTVAEIREEAVARAERAYLEGLLRLTHGRIGETARRAGITPRSLYTKMKRLELRKEDFKPDKTRASNSE
jgi:DNA-binding NtrC family response regulator